MKLWHLRNLLVFGLTAFALLVSSPKAAFAGGATVAAPEDSATSAPQIPPAGSVDKFVEGSTYYVAPGSKLFTDVYLNPDKPPYQIMIQYRDENESWEHRVYWGDDHIPFGTPNTSSRRRMGNLPREGQWERLEFSARDVGLEGRSITGISYTVFEGEAAWVNTGIEQVPAQPVPVPNLPATVLVPAGKNFGLALEASNNPTGFRISSPDGSGSALPSWLALVGSQLRARPVPADASGTVHVKVTAYNAVGEGTQVISLRVISPDIPKSILIEPASVQQLEHPGDNLSFKIASAKNHFGDNLSKAKLSCRWTSSNPEVLSVNSSGLATTTGIGSSRIQAVCGSAVSNAVSVDVIETTKKAVFTSEVNVVGTAGRSFRFQIAASNVDSVTVKTKPEWIKVSGNGGKRVLLSASPIPSNVTGDYSVSLEGKNAAGTTRQVLVIHVSDPLAPTTVAIAPSETLKVEHPKSDLRFRITGIRNHLDETLTLEQVNCDWISSNPNVVTIDSLGRAATKRSGISSIRANCGVESNPAVVEVGEAPIVELFTPSASEFITGNVKLSGAFPISPQGALPASAQLFVNGKPDSTYQFAKTCTGPFCGKGSPNAWEFYYDSTPLNLGTNTLQAELTDTAGRMYRTEQIQVVRAGVQIRRLVPNALVSGLVPLTAHAIGQQGITRVEFFLDTMIPTKRLAIVSQHTDGYYSATWDSCAAQNGPHNIVAVAFEPNGAVQAHLVAVNVANTSCP